MEFPVYSLNAMYFGVEDVNDNEVEGEATTEESERCTKLTLSENIAAYVGKQELVRETKPLLCSNNLIENITCNYIIVKQIISNLSWQEKLICKHVCTTWRSAVQALQRELISPEDFMIDFRGGEGKGWFKQSRTFYTEPLVVFTFANTAGFSAVCKCKTILPNPCKEPCEKEHSLIDLVNRHICAPKNCMLSVKAHYLVYRPLAHSRTFKHSITHFKYAWTNPFIGGLYIPMIPDVGFHIINIKSQGCLQQKFYETVDELATNHIIKGVIVYVTEKYILNSVEDIVFLNYFRDVQPTVPYALGGCIVEDTITEQSDINLLIDSVNDGVDFISENLLTIGIFTIPKNATNIENNFQMYSFVIDSSDWSKADIQGSITKFSKKVPRFEHSVALKLSCVGRDKKHVLEQDCFQAVFPNTRIVGCYGNGELGLYHPAQVLPERPPKRHRRDSGPQFGIMYSYSTVFVYFGWGKITSEKGSG